MKNKTNDPNVQSADNKAQDNINMTTEIKRDAWYNSANDSDIYCDEYEIADSRISETF